MKTDGTIAHPATPLAGAGRVAIVRLRSLGDCVLATPAIHLLKQFRPQVEIAVVVERIWAPVFERNPDISVVLPPSLRNLRGFRPDICIDLHGGNTAARLTLFSGARHRAGFAHFKRRFAYNLLIPTAQQITGENRRFHTAEHVATAMFYLGVPRHEVPRARLFTATAGSRRDPYAVIHPVAAMREKTWPAEGFHQVAKHLRDHHHLESVFIGAHNEDLSAFSGWPVVRGASLDQLKTLIAGAKMFVGNDSGPAHIAAAFGVPPVVIFGPSDPVTWGPWRIPGEVVKSEGPIAGIDVSCVTRAIDRMRVLA